MSNEQLDEFNPQAKDPAPRVSLADIEANIASEYYFTAGHGVEGAMARSELWARYDDANHGADRLRLLTFCVLILRNGFTVTGESACVSPENFDAGVGRKIARQNAVAKMWPLMGYELQERLSR